MTVAEMLERISSRELTEWAAFEQLDGPLHPGRRLDIAAGTIAATVANANRGKRGRRYRPDDFVPEWGGREPQSVEQQLAVVTQINRALGGKDLRRERRERG